MADAAATSAERGDWMTEHLAMYLESGGARGHIVDLSSVGGRELTTHCLIKYTGRKSGKSYVKPLIYGNVGGEVVVVASKGGRRHPPGVVSEHPGQRDHRCADRHAGLRGQLAGTRRH